MKEPRKSPPRKPTPSGGEARRGARGIVSRQRSARPITPTSAGGPERSKTKHPRPDKPPRDAAEARRRTASRLHRRPDNERAAVVASARRARSRSPCRHRERGPLRISAISASTAVGRAADQRLDRAVGPVAHPAGDAQPQRRAAGELAIADALDARRRPRHAGQWRQFRSRCVISPWTMRPDRRGRAAPDAEALMTLEEIFDIARRKRFLVVSTVNESGAPEAALMGFALTQANEVVFDTLSTSRKAVNLARNTGCRAGHRLGRQRFSSDRRSGPPAGRRRLGERQGGLFPRMAGRPRP